MKRLLSGILTLSLSIIVHAEPQRVTVPPSHSGANGSPPSGTQAPSNGHVVFGLELGKPLSIPPCPHKQYPSGRVSELVYEPLPSGVCYEPDVQLRDAPWRRGSFVFPPARTPLIMHGNDGFTLMIDGKLEGLEIDTMDHNHTDAILQELIEKFGRPTSSIRDKAIVAGIAVPDLTVTWRLPGLLVRYRNIEDSLEYGSLRIETPVMQRLREQHEAAQREVRTPL